MKPGRFTCWILPPKNFWRWKTPTIGVPDELRVCLPNGITSCLMASIIPTMVSLLFCLSFCLITWQQESISTRQRRSSSLVLWVSCSYPSCTLNFAKNSARNCPTICCSVPCLSCKCPRACGTISCLLCFMKLPNLRASCVPVQASISC